ncbi:MAG: UDP-N-acetylglucosamine 4,6-dehydratase (inverting) [Candidatus Endolissoclinum sp. TMED37]|nr:MAG: UDP-N-acetylglucosamine 4,6-dehydratase (inverting) [Candidatus Endolissoclinum sp. TMED37]|tara:strand:- start:1880 stop:2875 length:996 start_codon:yes stop_codon:yes gene_type:complete
MYNNKSILITGGTGSFGKEFVRHILAKYSPKRIIIYSRDEMKQYEMEKIFPDTSITHIRYFIGDVRDYTRLKLAMENVDIVIHAAALKHVDKIEYNPFEAVKTNIIGAQNVIDSCFDCNVKKVIALSTDKAAAPINLYGATKLASDKLFVAANNYKGKKNIKFSVVRYGNVFASRGSVIPFFISQKDKGLLPITDKRMTRFNITLKEGVEFVSFCLKNMKGGEIFIPKISSYKLVDLAKAISPNIKLKIIGLRPGEKLHEEMITLTDSLNTIEFKKYFIIIPQFEGDMTKKYKKDTNNEIGKKSKKEFSYNSNNNKKFLSIKKLKSLINNL